MAWKVATVTASHKKGYHPVSLRTRLLAMFIMLLCYAAVLINFTYYSQYYAHVKDLCLAML